ncbi:MAG: ThuA domain-containing protein [Verrucomicrobiales bacterium]|jgi:trehalose utilization protein|nr:ThuA domain-containing protein [Verrucomicrobiales bacterium]
MKTLNVVVWNEYVHETTNEKVAAIYPQGIHRTLADAIQKFHPDYAVSTATLAEPEHGLTQERLDQTEVLLWWGHGAHDKVADAVVDRVQARVLQGMGLIVLHSGHYSKIFRRLMGTGCGLQWREANEKERLWVCNPGHPIAAGLDASFTLPEEEMYGEPFGIPTPEEQVFVSWFEGGEVLRSGCCWHRGNGKIFYFQPGHETYPIYHDANIQRVIANAVAWAAPQGRWPGALNAPHAKVAPEPLGRK